MSLICKVKKMVLTIFAVLLMLLLCINVFPDSMKENGKVSLQSQLKEELLENIGNYDSNKIVLQNTNKSLAKELSNRLDAKLRITNDGSFATLTLKNGNTILDVVSNPENKDILKCISIDYKATVAEILGEEEEDETLLQVNKPNYEVTDPYYDKQTYLDYINLSNIWNYTKGENITVAVIDTGIDYDHPEFEGKISEYSYNATEDKIVKDYADENGDYDWSLVDDEQGHGTAVTGVIAAGMNNSIGITGIAPNVTIITIKAECNPDGSFKNSSDLVFGLYYAIERDVDVINMSFGGPFNIYSEATKLSVDSDIICVAAAGNDSTAELTYPAADPNVIGVGALGDNSFELATYSNYGENTNVVAPGTVYTTLKNSEYGVMNGTSFASPIVAAIIALQISKDTYSYLEYSDKCELLYASSYDLGDLGRDFYFGYGAIDTNAFILEDRKTVTFNYLTDEIDSTTQVFIKGHPLQNIPEPERNYAVFDGWYYDIHCIEEYNLYADTWVNDITLYCNWVNEDDGVPYTYVELDDGTIEIRSYTGKRRYITIPDYINEKVVSSIGKDAFKNQTRLRIINLPSKLKTIKDNAFENCTNLTSIYIPDSVISIGVNAFKNNIRLYNVNFNSTSKLEIIGKRAFSYCTNLVRFDIPVNVLNLNGLTFLGCTNLKQVNANNNSQYYYTVDGVLYNKSMTSLLVYPAGLKFETYDLPESVTKLDVASFAYSNIKTIYLKNVTNICDYAFYASKINSIDILDTVTQIGTYSFSWSQITSVLIGKGISVLSEESFSYTLNLNKITIPNNVLKIDNDAFSGSTLNVVIFEENSNLMSIGNGAFSVTKITAIDLPNSVVSIGSNAFWATKITTIDLPNSVVFIGSGAFKISSLLNINISDESSLVSIGDSAFYNTYISNINLPSNLEYIGSLAFYNTYLEEVNIPASVNNLSSSAFASCHSLENIYIDELNEKYTDIDGVVYTKDLLTIHEYPAGKVLSEYAILDKIIKVEEYAFYGSHNLNYIYLPETLIEICEYAFAYIENLYNIIIPDNVTLISRYAFYNDYNLSSINISNNSKLDRLSYASFANCGIYSFTVPSNVSTISQYVFINCPNLILITIASNSKIESISAYQFIGCDNLQTIIFESGSKLTNIEAHAFEGMDKLYSIDFGDAKIENIDNFAFRYCSSLSNITIPETVTNIGRYAFYGCSNLSNITIPESVEFIGRYAFHLTNNLNVYFTSSVLPLNLQENWDYGINGYYVGVKEVYTEGDFELAKLSDNTIAIIKYSGTLEVLDLTTLNLGTITQIGGYVFNRSSIEEIVLPNTIKTIEKNAFANSSIEKISIPSSVVQINDNAFYNSNLNTITFEENSNLEKIGTYAFSLCDNLTSINIPSKVEIIGSYAFSQSGLENVTFDENINLIEISEGVFQGTAFSSINIPNSVTLINHNAFRDIETLKEVNFGTSKVQIMSNAFYNTGLTTVNIPSNIEYIGEYAFVGLNNLNEFIVDNNNPYYTSVDGVLYSKDLKKLIAYPGNKEGLFTVPKSVEVIGFGAFENSKLESVNFEDGINLLTLGYRAFYNAKNLKEIAIPQSVVSIDYYAFAMCKSLETVNFSNNSKLTGIYEGAFYGCISLSEITIPDEIYEISDYAFYGCLQLDRLPINENSELLGIYDFAFANSGIEELVLPGSLLDIGSYAFQGLEITNLIIPDANKEQLIIGLGAFNECNSLEEITIPFIGASLDDEELGWFGYIFGAGRGEANSEYVPESLKKVIITEGQTILPDYAFYNIPTLEEIDMPSTIKYLGEYNMYETTAKYELENEIMPIQYEYSSNNEIVIYENMIGKGIIGTIKLSNEITAIGLETFEECSQFTSVVIPNSITRIEYNAFNNCMSLINVYFEGTIEDWCNIEYYNDYCSPMNDGKHFYMKNENNEWEEILEILIPETVLEIKAYQFYGFDYVRKIKISDGVKSIGAAAFAECSSLLEISIPEGVESLNDQLFRNCVALYKIEIPNSLISIGNDTFRNCFSLKSITIPENIIYIDEYGFHGCNSLYEIINKSDYIFDFGSEDYGQIAYNAKVIIDKNGNKRYRGTDNSYEFIEYNDFTFIKESDQYKLVGYTGIEDTITLPLDIFGNSYSIYELKGVKNVIVPEGMTSLGYCSFAYNYTLESITLPSSLEIIEGSAFFQCTSLKKIILPENLKYIGSSAFNGCKSLKGIIIPNSVLSLGNSAFYGCESLEKITLSENLFQIEDSTFLGCKALNKIIIPENIVSIESYAFRDCSTLTEITIPENVCNISASAFMNCNFDKFEIDSNNKHLKYEDDIIYNYDKTQIMYVFDNIEKVSLPDTMTYVPSDIFVGCIYLTDIIIPNGMTKIESRAFANCTSLENITIPSTLKEIDYSAFESCESLKNIYFTGTIQEWCNIDFKSYSSNPMIFAEKIYVLDENNNWQEVKELILSESLTEIKQYSLQGFKFLTDIIIPGSITKIGDAAFEGCVNLKNIYYCGTIEQWMNFDFEYANYSPMFYAEHFYMLDEDNNWQEVKELIIPGTITEIKDCSFAYFKGIEKVIISDGVKTIGNSAFNKCSTLSEVIIADSVTNIGPFAFNGCSSLTKVKLSNNIKKIDDFTFSGCVLRDIIIPDSVTNIGKYAFQNCNLINITIPSCVKSIEQGAFSSCTNLMSITLCGENIYIGSDAFFNCNQLYEINNYSNLQLSFGSSDYGGVAVYALSITDINGNVSYKTSENIIELFDYNNFRFIKENGEYKLIAYVGDEETVTLPLDIFGEDYTIYKMVGAKNVIIPEGFTKINEYAFYESTSLRTIIIPNSVLTIEPFAFYRCDYLENVTIPESVENIGSYAFAYCNSFTSITIPEKISVLENSVLEGCFNIEAVILPSNLIEIGQNALNRCYNLKEIIFPKNLKIIEHAAFIDCTSLKKIDIPNEVETINSMAFQGCTSLIEIYIPENIQFIGDSAFSNTAYYNDIRNWKNESLYIGNCLIKLNPKTKEYLLNENVKIFAQDALSECYVLEKLKLSNNSRISLNGCTNLKTLIIDKKQNENIISYFSGEIPISLKNIVFTNNSIIQYDRVFENINDVNIFVDMNESYLQWDHDYPNWNNGNKVYYKGEWINTEFYDENYTLISSEYYSINQIIKQPIMKEPIENGYIKKFIGWDIDGDGFADSIPATSNIDIKAKAVHSVEEYTYTVNYYDLDGKTIIGTQYYSYNDELQLLDNLIKKGYIFNCWTNVPTEFIVNDNLNIYSLWTHLGDGHVYKEQVVEATCTEKGYTLHKCSVCDEEYKDNYTDQLGHSYGDWITDKTPSCETEGLKHRVCSECSHSDEEVIDISGHSYESTIIKQSSCEEQGQIKHVCSICNDIYIEHTNLLEHNYEKKYVSKSSLKMLNEFVFNIFYGYEGDKAYYYECVNCKHIMLDNKYTSNTASVQGVCEHNNTNWNTIIKPTLIEIGYEVDLCADCNEIINVKYLCINQEHDYIDIIYEATCYEQGYTLHKCSVCNNSYKDEFVSVKGHNYETVVTSPICTEQGYTTYTCSECGDSYEDNYTEAKGHTEVIDEVKEATCTETGLTEGSHCLVCNEVLVAQTEVPVKGHNYESVVTKPTCTEQGYITYTCSECSDSYVSDYKDALGHTEVIDEAKESTCTETGLTEGKHCLVCNEVLVAQTEVPAKGHNYESVVINPTCIEQGYTTYTCIECGDSYKDNYTEAKGHTEVIDAMKEATCAETGLTEGSHCSVCNEVLVTQEVVPAKCHNYEFVVTNPTCTEQGYTTYTCSECNDSYVSDYKDELGHTEVIDEAIDATCTETGLTEGKHCSVCNEVLVAQTEIPANGHNYETSFIWNDTIPSFNIVCLNDNSHNQTLTPEVSSVIVKEATTQEEGIIEYYAFIIFNDLEYTDTLQVSIPMLEYEIGDLDSNEQLNSDDAIYLLMNTYFPEQYPVGQECDYNNDNLVNSDDAIYLLMHVYFPSEYPLEQQVTITYEENETEEIELINEEETEEDTKLNVIDDDNNYNSVNTINYVIYSTNEDKKILLLNNLRRNKYNSINQYI